MKKLQKVIVITNSEGRVVGIHQPAPVDASSRLLGGLRAGPGQTLHEIEIEAPEKCASREDIAQLEAAVHQRMQISKPH